MIGLGVPRRRDRVPGAGPAASSGRRCAAARCSRRRLCWSRAWRSAPGRWGLLELFPGSLARDDRFRVRAEPGERVRRRRSPTASPGTSARVRQRAARTVRRAGPDGRRDRAVPVPAGRERAHRRGRVGDPRPARVVRQERLAGLLRHPPRQGGGVRPQRPRGHHLPRRGRRLPGQRRPGRRPEGVAAGDRGLAASCARPTAGRRA